MYTHFAYVYDQLMEDVDYRKWADYIEKIFKKNSLNPKLLVDLACGTGNFCIEMAQKGYEMIGIDGSTDMLHCARQKAEAKGLDILYLNQNMTDFELYGTVDAIVCLLDSVNYLTKIRDVEKLCKLVNNYLNPEGLFVFDINTVYKFEKVLDKNVFYDNSEEITYIWDNAYNKKSNLCTFDLTFFVKQDKAYVRFDETHVERAYEIDEMKRLIENSGLTLVDVYHELSFTSPRANSQRIFFVCRKGGG